MWVYLRTLVDGHIAETLGDKPENWNREMWFIQEGLIPSRDAEEQGCPCVQSLGR